MAENTMWSICGSEFWNNNLTWYSNSPRFTPCFEKTVMVWVPCIFLWLFIGVDLYYTFTSKTKYIPWNWRNKSKLVIIASLITISIFDLFYTLFSSDDVYPIDIFTPLLKIFYLMLCATLVIFHRKYGQRTSGLMFIFWFLIVVMGFSQFSNDLNELLTNEKKDATRVTSVTYYCFCVIMFWLQWIADLAPLHSSYPPVHNPCPKESSSFPNRLMFTWLDKTIYLGFKRPLVSSDLWSMRHEDCSSQVFASFDKYWSKAISIAKESSVAQSKEFNGTKTPQKTCSILPSLCKAFGPAILFGASFKLIQDILTFANPQLLKCLIGFIDSDEPEWRGYFYASLLLLTNTIQLLLSTQYAYVSMMIGLNIKTALNSAIYRKSLRLSNSARKGSTLGEIVNLMAVDTQRFYNIIISVNTLWSIPLQIILAVIFLWQVLGPSVLAGLTVLIIMIPINGLIAKKTKSLQIKQMKHKDERVKMMNEILSGMKKF